MSIERRPRGMLREGLTFGVREALVVGGMFAATETWLVPLLQSRLGAAAAAIGLLTIIPQVVGIGMGPVTRKIIDLLGGNKRASVITAAIQCLALAALSVPLHAPGATWAVPLAVSLIVTVGAVGTIGGPSWVAWMGGLIPRSVQGRYTGRRLRVFHASRLACAGAYAGILHFLPLTDGPWGLQVVLVTAVLSRLASMAMLWRQGDPPKRPDLIGNASSRLLPEYGGFWHFVKTMPQAPLGRWTLVWSLLHFGVMIAGPFFASYMLASKEHGGLGLAQEPFTFTLLIYTSTIARLVTYPAAGKLVDLHGPAAVLRVAVVMIMLIPIGWILSSSLWVIVLFEILSGIAWCLAEIAVGPLLFSCHRDPQQRAQLIGWHQSVVMTCIVLGSGLGTVLLGSTWLPVITGSVFHTLFLVSMLCRLPAVIMAIRLLPALRELPHDKEGHGELWRLIPGAGITTTVGRGLGGFFRRTEGE